MSGISISHVSVYHMYQYLTCISISYVWYQYITCILYGRQKSSIAHTPEPLFYGRMGSMRAAESSQYHKSSQHTRVHAGRREAHGDVSGTPLDSAGKF